MTSSLTCLYHIEKKVHLPRIRFINDGSQIMKITCIITQISSVVNSKTILPQEKDK